MKQKMIDFLNIFQAMNKSIVMLLLIAIGVSLRLKAYLSGEAMVDLLKTTTVSYFSAHVAQTFTAMIRDHLASKNAPLAIQPESDVVAVSDDDTIAVKAAGASNGK